MKPMHHYSDVTLLVTHYNRSHSLERLLRSFLTVGVSFGDIVISDDGSKKEHLERLEDMQKEIPFRLVTTERNRGLGNNINKGQDAVNTPLTLYVQEDFIAQPAFPESFKNAHTMIEERQDLDFIRFYAYIRYPHLKPYKYGFSEMIYKPWSADYLKIYFYSDHPHLRRSSFLEKFGRYSEKLSGDKTEYQMCLSVIQKKAKALFFEQYKELFEQYNPESEPSTMHRVSWTQGSNPLIKIVRYVYRQVKYNYELLFKKLD